MAEAQFVIRAKDEATPVFQRLTQSAKSLESQVNSIRFGAAGIAIAAIATGLGAMAKGAIDAADDLDDLSQKVGVSVERLSELKLLLDVEGVSTEQLQQGLKTLSQVLVQAGDATSKQAELLKSLGVSARDPYEAIRQIADAFQQLPDGPTKGAAAVQLLGRAGLDLIPALNGGSAAIDAAADSARRFGLVVSSETAASAAQFNDNMTKLRLSADALGIALSQKLVKGLADVTSSLVKAREEGRLLNQVLQEGLKFSLEAAKALPGGAGALASILSARNEAAAQVDAALIAQRSASGRIGGLQAVTGPDEAAVARALGGSATAAGRGAAGGETLDSLLAKASQKRLEMQDAAAQEAEALAKKAADDLVDLEARAALLRVQRNDEAEQAANDRAEALRAEAQGWREVIDPIERYRRELERINELEREGALTGSQAEAAREKVNESVRKLATDAKETRDLAKDIGFAFASSFEEAVVAGKKLSDVIRGLGADIAKILLRETVTKPIAGALGKILDGFKLPGFATGGSFMVGGAGGTDSQLVAFRATPNERVTIETPGQQSRGGGVTISQSFNFAGNADQSAVAMLRAEGNRIVSLAVQAVQSQADRGGSFARAVGRR